MNVTGVWRFYEEFNGGYDLGYATLIQKGDDVSGSLVYTEYIENEDPFVIAIDVVGEVYSERVITSYSIHYTKLYDRPFKFVGLIENSRNILAIVNFRKVTGRFA